MNSADKLFTLLQVTRHVQQYGYALFGVTRSELSYLAEHHFLVTAMAQHLSRMANKGQDKRHLV